MLFFRASILLQIFVAMNFLTSCVVRNNSVTIATDPPLQRIRVIPQALDEGRVKVPSYPVRVFAKFMLSGVSLGPQPTSDALKRKRFLQALEYLDAYFSAARGRSFPGRVHTTYGSLLGEVHANLKPEALFSSEMAALIDPQSGRVIPPRFGHLEASRAATPNVLQTWKGSREGLEQLLKSSQIGKELSRFLSGQVTFAPKELNAMVRRGFHNTALDAVLTPLTNTSDHFLSLLEKHLGKGIEPFTTPKQFTDVENLLRTWAAGRTVLALDDRGVIAFMNRVEKLLREVKSTAQERIAAMLKGGFFASADVATQSLLRLVVGRYIEELPEEFSKNLISDLIDAAEPQMSDTEAMKVVIQSMGPLAKKTLQLFSRKVSLSPEAIEVLQSVESANEAMAFGPVLKSIAGVQQLKITALEEKAIGVGSVADVYRAWVEPQSLPQSPQLFSAENLQQEWNEQTCLLNLGKGSLTRTGKGKKKQVRTCGPNEIQPDLAPQWIQTAQNDNTIPIVIRLIKPHAQRYLDLEKKIFRGIVRAFDAEMEKEEAKAAQEPGEGNIEFPRLSNDLSSYILNIEKELNAATTVDLQTRARGEGSSYESLVEMRRLPGKKTPLSGSARDLILRTRVPRTRLLRMRADAPLRSTGGTIQEYLPGSDLTASLKKAGYSQATSKRLVKEIVKIWLRSALYDKTKLVHADLHPGNILSTLTTAATGESIALLSFVDFGMTIDAAQADTNEPLSESLVNLGLGAQFNDVPRIVRALRGLARSESVAATQESEQTALARIYLRTRQQAKLETPIEIWFQWIKDRVPAAQRLEFGADVTNLIRGYLTVSELFDAHGGTAFDAVAVNLELAMERAGHSKDIWDAYWSGNKSSEERQGLLRRVWKNFRQGN